MSEIFQPHRGPYQLEEVTCKHAAYIVVLLLNIQELQCESQVALVIGVFGGEGK